MFGTRIDVRYYFFISASLLYTFFLSFSIHAATPGLTAGEFSVDSSGGANYTVPIVVPPGTSGMQPSLSLSYNSRSGNGLLGVGFTLGGLSVITRCPANTVIDGEIDGVDFDDKDRFCLDGQRLIAVVGTYGSNNTEYRTEIDGFTKVKSYGSTGNGPQKFMAWTKSGQVLEYGYTADARIEAEGKSDARLWAVNKISDTVGNYLTVTYDENGTDGTYKPIRIDYTGNTGLSPYAKVEFEYETRSDVMPLYFAGSLIKNTERLTNIKTYTTTGNGVELVRDYQLTYDNNGAANRSRITQITECGKASECFKPIQIGWEDNPVDHSYAINTNLQGQNNYYINWIPKTGDFNGDGISDILWDYVDTHSRSLGTRILWLGNGDGTFNIIQNVNNADGSYNSWVSKLADFNADGITDILWDWADTYGRSRGYRILWLGNGDGTFNVVLNVNSADGSYNQWASKFADFNADGITDILWDWADTSGRSRGYRILWLGNGDGTFNVVLNVNGADGSYNQWASKFSDFNGDGITDILWDWVDTYGRSRGYRILWLGNGDGTFEVKLNIHGQDGYYINWQSQFADFNGDGVTDILWDYVDAYGRSQGTRILWLGKGDGTYSQINNVHGQNGYYINWKPTLTDFNSDGLTDILWDYVDAYGRSLGSRNLWISKGDGTFNLISNVNGQNGYYGGFSSIPGDFDGDGITDILWDYVDIYGRSQGYRYLWTANKEIPDQVTSTTSSLGTKTEVTYKPLTDTTVYTKGTGATFPEVDIVGPVYVVSSVKNDADYVSNGSTIPHQRETTYHYEGAKSSFLRGFLGFETMRAQDVDNQSVTVTTYQQGHPYTGMVSRTQQYTDNDTPNDFTDDIILGDVETSFENIKTHDGNETVSSHPGVLFPYAKTVTKRDYVLASTP